uniref:Variant surface glycoprotein n=1 Tax=Trypanosoma brucei TaxID=5691 RepID=A0A1V0FYB8_9TRYP|nr:variant surface glycoprotein [Trypanosoma brucei]
MNKAAGYLEISTTATSNGASSGANIGTGSCSVTAMLSAGTATECPLGEPSDAEPSKILATLSNLQHVHLEADTEPHTLLSAPKINLQGQGSGTWSAGTTGGCTCTSTNCGTTIKVTSITKAAAKTNHVSKTTVDLNSDNTPAPAAADKPTDRQHRTAKKLAALLKNVKAKMNAKPKMLSTTTLEDLTSFAEAAELSRDLLSGGNIDDKVGGQAGETFTNLIKTKLGPEQDDFTRKFVTPLDSIPVNFKKGDEPGPKTIGEAAASNDIPIALAYIQGKSQRQATVASPTATSPVNCSTQEGKTAEECAALGCGHDKEKKKCKPKSGSENKTPAGTGEQAAGEQKKEEKCLKHGIDTESVKSTPAANGMEKIFLIPFSS